MSSGDIKNILSKIDALSESGITPVNVKHGLNPQQKSAPQIPALFKPAGISVLKNKTDPQHPAKKYFVGCEDKTTEDVISSVKKKLGDYLQDVASAIKKDPQLIDKIPKDVDQIGPAVKTITTDDGHELKIHGNEDDGFRITIKNRPHSAHFENLEHAVMACEMVCNKRRQSAESADYMEEK
jgi:propanediol dehydratase large subunit